MTTTLDQLALRQATRIAAVHPPAAAPEWHDWLAELGFLPGEMAMVLARAPGGDPLVIRVGSSTFALRAAEAACVAVTPLDTVPTA